MISKRSTGFLEFKNRGACNGMSEFKIGSLFDGSGGFPLAGSLCGIDPVWASEVEPYPIAVTRSRFPNMKHLGDISKINGAEIEPVDIITFGSPCQDMSVAGKRAGLKHEDNGDEETTRSGLFMEAIRIIKEMREATNGRYPTFAVWENVPGAFSSNKGEDFRVVLEELIKIVEPSAVMPAVPQKGWAYADYYCGDGWSIAYRVLDAQYWGVPQRRRRIYLVADFRGERAREVLFEREGVRGYFAQGGTPWQATPANAQGSIGADDRAGECVGFDAYNQATTGDKAITLCATRSDAEHLPCVISVDQGSGKSGANYLLFEPRSQDGVPRIHEEIAPTLNTAQGGQRQPCVVLTPFCKSARARSADDATTWKEGKVANTLNTFDQGETRANELVVEEKPVYCLQGNGIDRADTAGCNGKGWNDETCYTLNTIDRPAVAYGVDCRNMNENPELYPTLQAKPNGGQSLNYSHAVRCRYIVRRLTPTECARLQGFPDKWGHPDHKDEFTDEEYRFWLDVRNTHAEINGKAVKEYTKQQMLNWYNKLHTDSSEYKMWGNGIALPCALYVMQGIEDALKGRECNG